MVIKIRFYFSNQQKESNAGWFLKVKFVTIAELNIEIMFKMDIMDVLKI
ncbi:MAG: hypothetical protein N2169_04830 [bacterium]|nr:hypothetical protein [bacterium]